MPTLDETLAQFYPSALTALPDAQQSVFLPSGAPDPVGVAIDTLRRVGATTTPGAMPPEPPIRSASAAGTPAGVPMPPVDAISGAGQVAPAAPPGPPPAGPAGAPPAAPYDAGLSKSPATMADADRAQNSAVSGYGQSVLDAQDKKFDAERAKGERLAAVAEASFDAREQLNNATIVQRQKNEADADVKTASWLQEMQDAAAKEPNPGRWWDNQSRLGKALWALSLVFGAGNAALTPGARNVGLEIVRSEMAADMEEQRQRLARSLTAIKLKGETLKERAARNASDLRDDHAMGLGRIDALERALDARATIPGDMDAMAMKAMAKQELAKLKLDIVGARRKETVDALQAATQRDFARQQQRAAFAHDTAERQATQAFTLMRDEKQHEYRLAESPVSIGASYTPGGPIPTDPKTGLPLLAEMQSGVNSPSAGLVLKGPDGRAANGTGSVRFKNDADMQKAGAVVQMANERYTAEKRLLDILEEKGDTLKTAAAFGITDPRMESTIVGLGMTIAKTHDSRISDKDYSKGVGEAMGFDPDGKWADRLKFAANIDDIKAKLREDIGAMPKVVSASLRTFNDAAVNGQGTEIVWTPHNLVADKVRERSGNEVAGIAPIHYEDKPVTTAKDYLSRRAAEAEDPERGGTLLPVHDTEAVDRVLNQAKGHGPGPVRAEAEKVLADLAATEDGLSARIAETVNPTMGHPNVGAAKEDAARLMAQLAEVRDTRRIVEAVSADTVAKATKTLDRLAERFRTLKGLPMRNSDWVNDDWLRAQAQREGIRDDESIQEALRKAKQ